MTDELVEKVADAVELALAASDPNAYIVAAQLWPNGEYIGEFDGQIHPLSIARAVIPVVLEEAAKVALEERHGEGSPWNMACNTIAYSIRNLGSI